jgi:hypothetical protein
LHCITRLKIHWPVSRPVPYRVIDERRQPLKGPFMQFRSHPQIGQILLLNEDNFKAHSINKILSRHQISSTI